MEEFVKMAYESASDPLWLEPSNIQKREPADKKLGQSSSKRTGMHRNILVLPKEE